MQQCRRNNADAHGAVISIIQTPQHDEVRQLGCSDATTSLFPVAQLATEFDRPSDIGNGYLADKLFDPNV
jgi:hypothetical protein